MAKKKQEHIVFDQMERIRKPINKKNYFKKMDNRNCKDKSRFTNEVKQDVSIDTGNRSLYWIGCSSCSGKS